MQINFKLNLLEVRIYNSNRQYSLKSIIQESFSGFVNSYYLAKQLASRDIKAMYRQSLFGFFWAVAPAFMSAAVWIFLQGTGTIKLSATSIPYPLYVVLGTTFWGLLNECLMLPMQSITSNQSVITKINFQKEALITLGILKLGFNLLIKFFILVLFLFWFKVSPAISFLYFIPILVLTIISFVSIGIIISPIGVLYSDVSRLIAIAMQLLMYLSPVVYAAPKQGMMKWVMELNPLSHVIDNIRNSLTGEAVNPVFVLSLIVFALVSSIIAMIIYRVSMPVITERMSS